MAELALNVGEYSYYAGRHGGGSRRPSLASWQRRSMLARCNLRKPRARHAPGRIDCLSAADIMSVPRGRWSEAMPDVIPPPSGDDTIVVSSPVVGCDGGGGALGHPLVYLRIEREATGGLPLLLPPLRARGVPGISPLRQLDWRMLGRPFPDQTCPRIHATILRCRDEAGQPRMTKPDTERARHPAAPRPGTST